MATTPVQSASSRYTEYCQSVAAYEQTWFADAVEPQQSFLRARPALRASLYRRLSEGKTTFTEDVYLQAGKWDAGRLAWQGRAIAAITNQLPQREAQAPGAVYFLVGLPGSGKTTSLRPMVVQHAGVSLTELGVSDADQLRVTFPEFAGGLGSGIVQHECTELMYERVNGSGDQGLQEAIINVGLNTIVDVIGDPEYLPKSVKRLRGLGRRVYVLLAQCPIDLCLARVQDRALSTGRFVPLDLVKSKDGVPEQALAAAIATKKLSGWAVVDTSRPAVAVVDSHGW